MTGQHSLYLCFLKTFAPPKIDVMGCVATCGYFCVGEVDISPQGESSNLRVYKKLFIAILFVSSKFINSPIEEKS